MMVFQEQFGAKSSVLDIDYLGLKLKVKYTTYIIIFTQWGVYIKLYMLEKNFLTASICKFKSSPLM